MKAAIAAHREKIEATKKERDGIAVYINELADKKTAIFMEIKDAEDKIAASHAELQSMKKIISELVAEVEQIKKAWDDKREIISSEKQAIAVYEQEVKRLRSKIEAITQVLVEQQSQAFEERLTVEAIEKEIDQKYGLKIGQHEATTEGTDPASDEEQLNRLHEKIRDLGPVNMGTIEEYDELKNRHDFLSQQQQDLTQSIAELEEAIGRINTTTKRKLREAYEALRTKFLEVFTSLFGGGKADILMTDEDNILETGLEIVAQPPGKKLQNINLLSGGEKALTSLAILFAGFLIKPSPLCILDEVDAALDESNTVRFARMIKDLSKDTQFIVITHNRVTMEVADYLYGITMEEAGVSKVISLEFSEVATVTTV
jgi:chromosome segregation protein